ELQAAARVALAEPSPARRSVHAVQKEIASDPYLWRTVERMLAKGAATVILEELKHILPGIAIVLTGRHLDNDLVSVLIRLIADLDVEVVIRVPLHGEYKSFDRDLDLFHLHRLAGRDPGRHLLVKGTHPTEKVRHGKRIAVIGLRVVLVGTAQFYLLSRASGELKVASSILERQQSRSAAMGPAD